MNLKKWLDPVSDLGRSVAGLRGYWQYFRDWRAYSRMEGAESLALADAHPCLFDRTSITGIDGHYFYQSVWAFKAIAANAAHSGVTEHIDIGSLISFVGMLTAVTKVTFLDIRPVYANIENFTAQHGSILALPFEDSSAASLSCLHVAEHIGLGRYGDPLDPRGTYKAARELARVLKPGGSLYFSLPVGKPRVCFNAHRVHSPYQILDYFSDLKLLHLAGTTDDQVYHETLSPEALAEQAFGCGFFHFTK